MSSVKCIGLMTAAGALATGGFSLYQGLKTRKRVVDNAQKISTTHGGKIPTGGMKPDGTMWDGFTTVEQVKKDTKKALVFGTTMSTLAGAAFTGVISALTLLAKAKIK